MSILDNLTLAHLNQCKSQLTNITITWKYAAGGCYCLLPGGDIWPHAETTPIIENTWHWPWCCRHPDTSQPATARLNCPGENKGWENISSFKYSWLAPSRPAQLSHHGGRPQLPRDRPVFRRVMSPGRGRQASHFGRRKWRKCTNTDSINISDTFYVDINIRS